MEYLYNIEPTLMASLPNTGEASYIHIVIILAVLGLALLGLTFWLRKRQNKDMQGPSAPKGLKGRGKRKLKPPQKPQGPDRSHRSNRRTCRDRRIRNDRTSRK